MYELVRRLFSKALEASGWLVTSLLLTNIACETQHWQAVNDLMVRMKDFALKPTPYVPHRVPAVSTLSLSHRQQHELARCFGWCGHPHASAEAQSQRAASSCE